MPSFTDIQLKLFELCHTHKQTHTDQ